MTGVENLSQRQLRVGEQIRQILSSFFLKKTIHDPILIDVSITVSMVKMTKDLKKAYVYVLPLGGVNSIEIENALNNNKFFFQKEIGKQIKTKFTPRLVFYADDSFIEADKINNLLLKEKNKEDLE